MLKRLKLIALIMAIVMICQAPAMADPGVPSHRSASATNPATGGGGTGRQEQPINFDLGSVTETVTAGQMVRNGTVNIQVGQTILPVTSSTLLTAAERLAVYQVVSTGRQSILLGPQGDAVGGTFTFGSRFSQQLSNLVIPQGVTAVARFGSTLPVNLAGNLTNAGTLYAVATNPQVTTAVISATNIFNNQGALISSLLPAAGLPGIQSATGNLNLNLTAVHDIINAGRIVSSGNLNLAAGGSIVNALPAGATGPSPIMQAMNSVNLMTGGGSITNGGLIAAANGNINIATQAARNIILNNLGGRLEALAGSVNIRDSSFTGKANFSFSGGDLVAQELNIHSGTGIVNANLRNASGLVNIYAGEAQFVANTPSLELGTIQLSGDPGFYNTQGNVVLYGTITTSGNPLTIAAGGDIVSGPLSGAGGTTAPSIDTSSTNSDGGAITLIAGAQFSTTGTSPVLPPASGDSSSTLTITGGSTTGGQINLTANSVSPDSVAITSLTSAGATSSGTGNGGNIILVAFDGTNSQAGAGTITLPTSVTINAAGAGSAKVSGNVTMIAGAVSPASGVSITSGPITATGGTGTTGGVVTMASATPTVQSNTTYNLSSGASTGGFTAGNTQAGSISTTGAISAAGNVSITSGSSITVGSISSAPPSGAGNTVKLLATGASGTIDVSSGGVSANGVSGSGGAVVLSALNGAVRVAGAVSANAAGTGSGGLIFISSKSSSTFNIGGSSASNGTSGAVTANASTTGSGGTIVVLNEGSGGITLPASANLSATSATTGNGATIILDAYDDDHAQLSSTAYPALAGVSGVSSTGYSGAKSGTGALTFSTSGATTVTASGAGASGNGGTIVLETNNASANAIANSGGVLTLTANAGTTNAAGGTVQVYAFNSSSNLTVGSSAQNITINNLAGTTSGAGGTIALRVGGTLSVAPSQLTSTVVSGSGQTYSLIGGVVTVSAGLTANGVGTGTGGAIFIQSNGSSLTIGSNTAPSFVNGSLSARGGLTSGGGGSITLVNLGGSIVSGTSNLNVTPQTSGNGGNVVLSANTTVRITGGGINASAVSSGSGGLVFIRSNSSSTFNIGSSTTNGTGGAITANAAGTGNGGTIAIINSGTNASVAGGITLGASANLSSTAATAGNGATIILDAYDDDHTQLNSASFPALAGVSGVSSTTYSGSKSGTGALIFSATTTLTASGVGASGEGGTIVLETNNANSNAISNSTGALTLNANATGTTTADGGTIQVSTFSSAATLTVNNAANALVLNNRAGTTSGHGGTISLFSGGTLTMSQAPTSTVQTETSSTGGATLNISATGNVTINPAIDLSPNAGHGGTINMSSGATLFINNPLTASGSGTGDGGTIILVAPTINDNAGNDNINADSGTVGKGGTIVVQVNDNTGIFIGSNPGSNSVIRGDLVARGAGNPGDGGSIVVINTGGFISAASSSLKNEPRGNGNGGSTVIYSSSTVQVTGAGGIEVDGHTDGDGGLVFIRSNSSSTFNITGAFGSNGINHISAKAAAPGSGGTVALINVGSGGVTLGASNDLTVQAATTGNGATVIFDAYDDDHVQLNSTAFPALAYIPGVSATGYTGTKSGTGPITFGNTTTINANGLGASGKGGTIILETNNASANSIVNSSGVLTLNASGGTTSAQGGTVQVFAFNSASNLTIGSTAQTIAINNLAGTTSGAGGSVSLQAGGTLSVAPGNLTSTVVSGDGPSYSLRGGVVTVSAGLNVSAVGTGNGGSILVRSNGSSLTIGSNTAPSFVNGNLVAQGAGNPGAGGSIVLVNTGGSITTTSAAINVAPQGTGDGGGVAIFANGSVQITGGGISANAATTGSGGLIFIESKSANTFNIGSSTTNGVGGALSANAAGTAGGGGTIAITNAGSGGITLGASSNLSATAGSTSGNGATIILDAYDDDQVLLNSTSFPALANVPGVSSTSYTGSKSGTGSLSISNRSISANPTGTSSAAGTIVLDANSSIAPSGITLSTSVSGGQAGTIQIRANSNTVNVQGSSSLTGQITASGTSVTLDVSQTALTLKDLTASNGSILVQNSGSSASLSVVGTVQTTGGTVSLQNTASGSSISVTGSIIGNLGSGTVSSPIVQLNSPSVTIANGVTLTGTGSGTGSVFAVSITTAAFTNNGTVTTNNALGINVTSSGALTLSGLGNMQITGTAGPIKLNAGGANSLSLSGSQTYSPGVSGSVTFDSSGASGASISIASGVVETIYGGGTINVTTPSLTFNQDSMIRGMGASTVNLNGNGNAMTVTVPASGTSGTVFSGTISTSGGVINFNNGSNTLQFSNSGSTAARLYLLGGAVTTTSGNATVNSMVTLFSDNTITMNVNGATLTNNGTILSTSAPVSSTSIITIQSTGALTLAGTTGTFSSAANNTFTKVSFIAPTSLTLNNTLSQTINNNGGGTGTASVPLVITTPQVTLTSGTTTSTATFATANSSATTIQPSSGGLAYSLGGSATSGTLNLNGGAVTSTSTTSTTINNGFTMSVGTASAALTINTPQLKVDGTTGTATGTFQTNGGTITVQPNATPSGSLTFAAATSGSSTAQLNLNGGAVSTFSTTGTTVPGNFILSSNNNVTLNVNGNTFTNNGAVSATTAGTNITVQSTGSLSLAGSPTGVTASFVSNSTGMTSFLAMTGSSTLAVSNGTALTVSGDGAVRLRAPNVTFAATSTSPSLTATGASAITVDSGNSGANVNLIVTVPSGFAGTLATTGGTIAITPTGTGTLRFSGSGGSATTLNLNGGAVTSTTSNTTTVDANVTVASDNLFTLNVNASTLNNSGTLKSSGSASLSVNGVVLLVQSTGALTVSGSGAYSLTGSDSSGIVPQVQFATSGNNLLRITGSNTFSLGSGGVNFMSQGSSASLTFDNSVTQTMTSGLYMYLSSPTITFGTGTQLDQSSAGGSTIAIDSGDATTALTINLPSSGTTTLLSGSFGTTINPYGSNQNLSLNTSGSNVFNINGGPVYLMTFTGDQTISAGLTLQSNNSIEFDFLGDGNFNVNGSISATTPASQITLNGFGSTVNMAGSPGTIGGGATSILVEADNLNFNSTYNFNASGGTVTVSTPTNNTGGISIANSKTLTASGASVLKLVTASLTLGTGSVIAGTRTTGTAIDLSYIVPDNGGNLAIRLPGGSATTATLQSSGGQILLVATGSLSFLNPNGGTTTLDCTGGPVFAQAGASALTVDTGLTLRGSGDITLNMTGATQFTDNGTITSTGAGSSITIAGGGATVGGTFTMAGTPQPITVSGGGSILLQGFNALAINSSFSFSTGAGGSVTFTSPTSITLAASAIEALTGGGSISVNSPLVTFGNGSKFSTDQASGTGMNFGIGFTSMTVNVPGSGTGTLQTSGASINIAVGTGLTIQRTASTSGTASFLVNGGPVATSIGTGTLTVGSNVNLSSNGTLTLSTPFATLVNNGTISGTAASGATATTISAQFLTNTGTITGSSGANIVLNTGAGTDLTITGSGSIAAVGTGNVSISAPLGSVNASQSQITGKVSGSALRSYSLTTTSGSNLTVGSISAGFGNLDITAGSPGSNTALTVAGGSSVTANEGTITIMNSDTTNGTIVVGSTFTSTLVSAYTGTSDTSLGNVRIVVGDVPSMPANEDPLGRPSNVTVNIIGTGAAIYWGESSITVNEPSVVNAFARTVIFNSAISSSSITLNGAVTVVADPPVPGARIIFATPVEPAPAPAVLTTTAPPAIPNPSSVTAVDALSGSALKWYQTGNSVVSTDLMFKEQNGLDAVASSDSDAVDEDVQPGEEDLEDGSDQGQSQLKPIAYVAPGAVPGDRQVQVLHTLEMEEGLVKHTGNTRITHSPGKPIVLRAGETLLSPTKSLIVQSGRFKVLAPKGACVLVARHGKVLTVRNLYETQSKSVRLLAGGKCVDVAAGEEIIAGPDDQAMKRLVQNEQHGRRRVETQQMADGIKIMRCEISLTSLLQKNNTLVTLRHSGDGSDRKIVGKVIKMAACLFYSTSTHGLYAKLP